jgi:PAS domain S-box-containing protein
LFPSPKFWWRAAALFTLAIVACVVWQVDRTRVAQRVYRIGWQVDPPFQSADTDGKETGLAVDLVREAARRRGIQLQWIQRPDGAESALLSKAVDLWPFVTQSPEREHLFHITDAYLETELCLLVSAASRYHRVEDLATARIGLDSLPINSRWVHLTLPNAKLVPMSGNHEVVSQVCLGQTDAAFLEEYTAVDALLLGGACAGNPLRWIAIPGKRSHLGVGSTFESRAAADAIRAEIGGMAADGKLDALGQWGYLSGLHLESVEALLNASRREMRLKLGIALFAISLVITLWQTLRIRRERNRTRSAERAHRETEQKLRLMANNLTEMVLAYDMNRRLLFANPAAEALCGYSVEELQTGFIDWVHPDDRGRTREMWESLFHGAAYDFEYRMITKSGVVKWVAATWGSILDETGRQVGVQGTERDITERKRAEQSLTESERRFRGLLENVQMAAIMVDAHGILTFCNDYFLQATGWGREEAIGRRITDFLIAEDAARVSRILENFEGDVIPNWTATPGILTKSGKVRWFQSNAQVLYDTQGKAIGAANLAVDITEHRALQEQYLQAQKMEGLGRLAGGVAHDFNNLLTVINGYSEMIFRKLEEADPLRPKIDEVRKAGARAADLTQQLLAFSRKQVTLPKALDLNQIVSDSESMWKRLLGENVELVTRLDSTAGKVMADPGQMHQVLMNLVVNARDAMPDGGQVAIETGNIDAATGGLSGHYVFLSVSDTGVGIDPATRQHIFDPFFTTKGPGEGTGLGLATVHGIVKQSQGWIEVESEPGFGSTFKIYLPRIAADAPGGEEPPAVRATPRCSETILLVEDQDDVRRFAIDVLEECGYRVLGTSSGPEALALAADYREPIELLVTDVVLPGMNGCDLADRLAAGRQAMRVLFTSGYTGEVPTLRGVLDRGLAYIPKPYSPGGFATKVREVLDSHR